MYLGQEIDLTKGDERGVIPRDVAAQARSLRASEYWERYDSIVVGPNANNTSRGWFATFAAMAAATEITLFTGREAAVGGAYCNAKQERADWAQDLYQLRVELIAPVGFAAYEQIGTDADFMPLWWTRELGNQAWLSLVLAESDEIARVPLIHAPGGYGITGVVANAAAAPLVMPGQVGEAHVSCSYKFPEPLMLAAKAAIKVILNLDQPTRGFFAATLAGPGNKLVPDGAGGIIVVPNLYTIRVSLCGPRYMQLRGARSA